MQDPAKWRHFAFSRVRASPDRIWRQVFECTIENAGSPWVENPETHQHMRLIPGEVRKTDVRVGGHIAISAPAVSRFLAWFEDAFSRLGKSETIFAAPAAHHRLCGYTRSSTTTAASRD